MTAVDAFTLRDATPSDRAFLLALYTSTRADEFAQFGWPPDMERAFMQLQFEAQRGDYERRHPRARCRIVELHACPIGRLWTARERDRIVVLDITIVGDLRGQGIGSECLRGVQRQAANAGLAVELQVVVGNPAQHLYERLGFRQVGESGVRQEMSWRLEPAAAPAPHSEEIHHEQA
ncbi:MAG TPA: GNAT family N-acetyltransferase [Burkholderiaceae bacterium]